MGRAESVIESYLIQQVKARGGATRKLTYQGRKGAPDRMCLLPNGTIFFVECKRPGEKPDQLQAEELAFLNSMGQRAFSADTREQVDEVLRSI
jgi:hypothetical protein